MWKQIEMLENHADMLTDLVDVRIFICQVRTINNTVSAEASSIDSSNVKKYSLPEPEGSMTQTTSPSLIVKH